MKKIFSVILAVLFLCLAAGVVNANVTPVEVERIKDCCFVRVRGAHYIHSEFVTKIQSGFLFYYKNIQPLPKSDGVVDPKPQVVCVTFVTYPFGGEPPSISTIKWFYGVYPGDVIDYMLCHEPIGYAMDFTIHVYKSGYLITTISDSVVIPPA